MGKEVKKVFVVSLLVFVFLFSFTLVFAQNFEIDYPTIFGLTPGSTLAEYVRYIFSFAVFVVGFILLGSLIWGGVLYMTAAGDPSKLKDAKNQITGAFLGVILLLSSYLILYTIDPTLLEFIIPPIEEIPLVPFARTPLEPGEVGLISLEIPYGYTLERTLWEKEKRQGVENLVRANENFLKEEIRVRNEVFNRISDLNKYLKKLAGECSCTNESVEGQCVEASSMGFPVDCAGDPCEENRDEMEEIIDINLEKYERILEFQARILEEKNLFEENLATFVDVERELLACQQEAEGLTSLNEYLSNLLYFEERNWRIDTLSMPGTEERKGDHLTFYCSIGGTIFDYTQTLGQMPYEGLIMEDVVLPEAPPGLTLPPERLECPIRFPLGDIVDQARQYAILLILKMEKLADLQQKMGIEINKMIQLTQACDDRGCKAFCGFVPNPCFYPPLNALPLCWPFNRSAGLQAPGGCVGEPCPPLEWFENTVNNIKFFEEESFKTIREIEQIFPMISFLFEDETNPVNLNNVRMGVSLCYSPDIEFISWNLLDCESAIGTLGPDGRVIEECHPRDFFCCLHPETGAVFPEELPQGFRELIYSVPGEKFEILEAVDGCPEGWTCSEEVKNHNQYDDAARPLKELLSCMRQELDKMQEQRELEQRVGEIAVITDPNLYGDARQCSWISGPLVKNGCSFTYEIAYGKERVSAHYGGTFCRFERKSYAVAFSDLENSDYLIEMAKKCRPDVYIGSRVPGQYEYLHISLAQAYGCGAH